MSEGYNYDSVCTAIDTELYKLATFEMLVESGVQVFVNTLLAGAIVDGSRLRGVIAESRSGREAFYANALVDCTAYGDLAAFAGAKFTEPNDYAVVNSIGVGNVSLEKLNDFLVKHDAPDATGRGHPQRRRRANRAVAGQVRETAGRLCRGSGQDWHVDGHDDRARQLLDVHQVEFQDARQSNRPGRSVQGGTGVEKATVSGRSIVS